MRTDCTQEQVCKIAFIACAGSAAGKERFAQCKTCAEAVEMGFKRGECKDGCVGVGSCVNSCTKGAMKLVDGKVVVDRDKCDGCGDCAKKGVCPQGLISMVPADASNFIPCSSTEEDDELVRKTCGFGCISCGECERACPEDAVTIVNNHAVIDYEKCVGCVACTVKCRKKIIVDEIHDLSKLKSTVAFVRCNGDGRSAVILDQMGISSCKEGTKLQLREKGMCATGCLGHGECVAVCRYNAISIVNGIAKVDSDKCVGCRDCTYACPQQLITIVPYKGIKMVACSSEDAPEEKAKYCTTGCTLCGDCKANCPNLAIYKEETHACIDPEICEDCNVCQYVCHRKVIKQQAVPDYIFLQHDAVNAKKGE